MDDNEQRRLERFGRLRPPSFSDVESEDAQGFLDKCQQMHRTVGILETNGVSFTTFQFSGTAFRWWEAYKRRMPVGAVPLTWQEFSVLLLEKFVPQSHREELRRQFEQLRQDGMSVTQYEMRAGEDTFNTWAELKVAICLQFFPENREYNARRKLRELRQTKSVRDYMRDMGDKDKLFAFIEGLKPYARMELQRQRVDTLPKAIQAAECLGDYHMETQKDRPQPPIRGGYNGSQPSNGGPNRNGGDRSASKSKTPSSSSNSAASVNNNNGRKPPSECRHCGGEHWNNQCPNTQINAQYTIEDDSDPDDSDHAKQVGTFNAFVGSIHNTLAGTSAGNPKKNACPITKKGKENADERPPTTQKRTLMFVDMKVNSKPIRELIDTGATHNYLASTQV
ncbi:uncharacterized protein [Nicotiana tomentosiformis]|uniref:uncharacterized protein n=1 Tax=Nicotiana tomentosiformis TaxID=4098 RepID=UPI00388CD21C